MHRQTDYIMADKTSKATVVLEVNGQQAQKTLDGLKKIAVDVRKEMDKAAAAGDRVTLKKLQKELRQTETQIKSMESTSAHVDKVLANLGKAAPNELQKTLSILKKNLNYIERGSKEWDEQVKRIKAVKTELAVMNDTMKESQSFTQRILNAFNNWAGAAATAALSIGGVIAAGKHAVEQYASMQQEEANVIKYTGMTEEQVRSLNDEFKKIDTRTSREQLNKLAQEAGRLGLKSQEDVMGFVRAADKINVALDDLGDGATLELSKLTDIFGVKEVYGVEESLMKVGSVINELSQNSTASASYLEEFAKRMAGVGKVANLSIPEIMGFAAVLDSNGQALEMSASALSKLTIDIFKESGKIAKAVGFDVKEFSDMAKNDANEALLTLLQRLKDLGGIDVLAPMFKEMGENGTRMSGVLAALTANIDQVRAQQEAANAAFQEGTSITNEFNVQNTTVQAKLEKARKQLTELSVSLGEKLLPVMSHFISGTSATLRVLSKLVDIVTEYKTAIVSTAAAIAAYTVAVNAKTVATKAYEIVVRTATTVQKGFNVALKENPIGLIAAAIAAATVAIKGYVDKMKEAKFAADSVAQVEKKVSDAMAEEKAKIETLTTIIHNNNVSLERRLEAIRELKSIVPGYNAELSKEGEILNENTEAIDKYLVALEAKMRYDAAYEMMMEQQRTIVKANLKLDNAKIAAAKAQLEYEKAMASTVGGSAGAAEAARWKNAREEVEKWKETLQKAEAESQRIAMVVGQASTAMNTMGIGNGTTTENNTIETTTVKTTAPGGGDVLAGVKKHRAQLENELLQSYARQEITKKQYEDKMLEIEKQYYEDALKLFEGDEKKRGKMQDKLEAIRLEKLKLDSRLIEKKAKDELDAEKQKIDLLKIEREKEYNEGKLTKEEYNKAVFDLDIEYLDKRLSFETQFGNAESVEGEKRIKTARHEADERKRLLDEEKKKREEIRNIMHEAFGEATQEDRTEYERQAALLDQVKEQMLAAAGDDAAKRLDIEKANELAILNLKKKYFIITEKEYQNSLDRQSNKFTRWLKTEQGQSLMQSSDMIIGYMSEIFSGMNDLLQGQVDEQTAKIEQKYDGLISRAEGNKNMEVELEKQKQQEIADIQNAASQRMYAMQVMEAVAQGAMAAINAYQSAAAIPIVGFVLGPIAAAAAAAATGIQIATIKKQRDASASSGYSEGGFTRKGGKYDVAGVVHAGEWVASQELVNSPVARPIINTLEQAQRTNTIASLRKQDVSDSITAPATLSRALSGNGDSSATLAATLAALTRRLNEPFVTVNTVSGDRGIQQAMDRYNKLRRNK